MFDKLSELPQISCIIPHLVEIKDSSYIGSSFQSIITKISTNKEYLFQNTKTTKFHEITFSKYCSFGSRGDVINPKFARKSAQTHISCTNGHRKIKINSKRNFEVRYSFMKLFSRNILISSPMLCRHHRKIESKRVKFVYHVELAARILKTEAMATLVQKILSAGRISFKRLCELVLVP